MFSKKATKINENWSNLPFSAQSKTFFSSLNRHQWKSYFSQTSFDPILVRFYIYNLNISKNRKNVWRRYRDLNIIKEASTPTSNSILHNLRIDLVIEKTRPRTFNAFYIWIQIHGLLQNFIQIIDFHFIYQQCIMYIQ